jgi:hypothetical protein
MDKKCRPPRIIPEIGILSPHHPRGMLMWSRRIGRHLELYLLPPMLFYYITTTIQPSDKIRVKDSRHTAIIYPPLRIENSSWRPRHLIIRLIIRGELCLTNYSAPTDYSSVRGTLAY